MKYLSVAAFSFLLWGGLLTLSNVLGILRYAFFKKRYSMIPFLGGVLTSLGLLLLPRLRPFAWVPLIVDPGCALLTAKLLYNWRTIFGTDLALEARVKCHGVEQAPEFLVAQALLPVRWHLDHRNEFLYKPETVTLIPIDNSWRFDARALYAALDAERRARGMSWQQVAIETGVSAATLTRTKQGGRLEVASTLAMVRWLGRTIESFTYAAIRSQSPSSP